MAESNYCSKVPPTAAWSFLLAFLAVTSVQLSYVSEGIPWLDCLAFLLVPSFLLFLFGLFRPWNAETKDYCVGLTLITACILFALFFKSGIEVGNIDDGYHNAKVVALSIKNSFHTQWQYIMPTADERFFHIEFIESIWAVFWRWTQWDFSIIILQALPILLLWQQLLQFFRKQGTTSIPGVLAAVTAISLPLLWSQQGSTFNDSVPGIFGGITLLLCYDLLKYPSDRRLPSLVSLAFISGLCLVSKLSLLMVGLLGLAVVLIIGFRRLALRAKLVLSLAALPSIIYFAYHQGLVWIRKGSPFYPAEMNNMFGKEFHSWYHYYYESDPVYAWVRDHAFNFKPFYVLASWLMDFKFDPSMTADPWVRGNGLVFTYIVVPTLLVWLIKEHKKVLNFDQWKNPCLLILGVILVYYLTFSGCIGSRFSLSFNIFILAWCLAWSWRSMEQMALRWTRAISAVMVCMLLFLTAVSYTEGILGKQFERKIFSMLKTQRQIFPQYVETSLLRKGLLQQLYAQSLPRP